MGIMICKNFILKSVESFFEYNAIGIGSYIITIGSYLKKLLTTDKMLPHGGFKFWK